MLFLVKSALFQQKHQFWLKDISNILLNWPKLKTHRVNTGVHNKLCSLHLWTVFRSSLALNRPYMHFGPVCNFLGTSGKQGQSTVAWTSTVTYRCMFHENCPHFRAFTRDRLVNYGNSCCFHCSAFGSQPHRLNCHVYLWEFLPYQENK